MKQILNGKEPDDKTKNIQTTENQYKFNKPQKNETFHESNIEKNPLNKLQKKLNTQY